LSARRCKPYRIARLKDALMLNSTNWVGYISAITLIAISFAAVVLAPKHHNPGQAAAPQLPPIIPATVDANFMGTHVFGLWTLVCENVHRPAAAGAPPAPDRRICRSNAQKRVRANNEILLAAGFNVLYAGPTKQPAVLFRLPPSASAGDHVDFAIDDNTMFQAPMGRCTPSECIVQGILPAEALAQMKTGRVLSIVYTANIDQRPQPVRVDQLLHGFPESFDALTKATGS
jgi:invasion protein IalB